MAETQITQSDIDTALAEIEAAPRYDAAQHDRFSELVHEFSRQATKTAFSVDRTSADWITLSWMDGEDWISQTPAQIEDLIAKLRAAL